MQLEDGIIEELEDKEREIEELGVIVDEVRAENEQVKQEIEKLKKELEALRKRLANHSPFRHHSRTCITFSTTCRPR
ncbi:hypothetical protein [Haliscomenobacter hydrossis]|uniref:Uncharacterized protein n=1 Tax=Haliscomenobacter hydrossis (strain ATCC 27775 / DSM 1100 / LMG 10767 / O) TaxID=760192 RepID=F4L5N9_HALH1|nr:hypothetical protein [Haliscomenobacter hydrossis]AEE51874.1 hypothetical protein Halhy_4026 [Haliscomenobacter hydrossis DSM 1100]